MSDLTPELYQFDNLSSTQASFRVVELLPGSGDAPITCRLHTASWIDPPEYEALSYAWGDPTARSRVIYQGKKLPVGKNLYDGLLHLRHNDKSRLLWVDCLCIHQSNIIERNDQVKQMRQIYAKAQRVIIWLGPDSPDELTKDAIISLRNISDFLCEKLDLNIRDLSTRSNLYHEVLYQNRASLPAPNECEFSTDSTWKSLIWFFKHSYFTRTWVIQEINATTNRWVQCGHEEIEWDRVDLVAGYIIMDTSFSQNFGFSKTHCWWAATVTTERMRQPKNWLAMLYLASNFSCTDPRDRIFALRGLMDLRDGGYLLDPDYSHSMVTVYRDSVAAALMDFKNPDVLFYADGKHEPSWVPQWNEPMLFRNPFRFGKALPWKPSGESELSWHIDSNKGILFISGLVVDKIKLVESYNENFFSDGTVKSVERRQNLRHAWQHMLDMLKSIDSNLPYSADTFRAVATAFSYGLDADANPAIESDLLNNFVAYLRLVVDNETYQQYVPQSLSHQSKDADGHAFGKPVWDFEYPESSFFVTDKGLIGCCNSPAMPGDIVFVASQSTYPIVLRPEGDHFLLRGFAFVYGIMHGELEDLPVQRVAIH